MKHSHHIGERIAVNKAGYAKIVALGPDDNLYQIEFSDEPGKIYYRYIAYLGETTDGQKLYYFVTK